jgi:nicotinamidase-related amidase
MKYLLICMLAWTTAFTQESAVKTALLLIDIQDFYFPGGQWELVEPDRAADNAAALLEHFRMEGNAIIHVRHDAEPGGQIHERLSPHNGETVITKTNINSFKDTELLTLLKKGGITSLVICGMQTHMCLEAATRAAADLGFNCTVIGDACATRDLEYNGRTVKAADVHASTLGTLKSYAIVTDTQSWLKK